MVRALLFFLCLAAFSLPGLADAVSDLVDAVNSGNEEGIVKATDKLMKTESFPEVAAIKTLKETFDAQLKEKEEKKKKAMDGVIQALARAVGLRGSLNAVDPLISILDGDDPATNTQVENSLARLTGFHHGEKPKLPEGAKESPNPWVNKKQVWIAWWASWKDQPGLMAKPHILHAAGFKKAGVSLPALESLTADKVDDLVNPLLAGLNHEKFHVRYLSAMWLFGLYGRGLEFDDEEQDAKKREPQVKAFRDFYAANKAAVKATLAKMLEEDKK